MSDAYEKVSVAILDRKYTLSCPPEKREFLLGAVDLVDSKMRELLLAQKLDKAANERQERTYAVMTAISLAEMVLEHTEGSPIVGQYGEDTSDPLQDKLLQLEHQLDSLLDESEHAV